MQIYYNHLKIPENSAFKTGAKFLVQYYYIFEYGRNITISLLKILLDKISWISVCIPESFYFKLLHVKFAINCLLYYILKIN